MITFAIPAYKEPKYIEELIISLKKQTITCKILIATSTPNNYLNSIALKNEIPIYINPFPKYSIADDWNYALSCVQTKYAVLAHQDDLYRSYYAELMTIEAENYPENLITFSFYSEMDNDEIIKSSRLTIIKKLILSSAFLGKSVINNNYFKKITVMFGSAIPCPAVMFNLENLRYFKFSDYYKVNLDWDAWINLSDTKGSFVYIPEPLMIHRLHRDSATFTGIIDNKRLNEDKEIFSRLWITPFDKIISSFYSQSYKSNINISH
jgi:hypothetical protein